MRFRRREDPAEAFAKGGDIEEQWEVSVVCLRFLYYSNRNLADSVKSHIYL